MDDAIRRQVEHLLLLKRYENELAYQSDQLLIDAYAEVITVLSQRFGDLSVTNRRRLLELQAELTRVLDTRITAIGPTTVRQLELLGGAETDYARQTVSLLVPEAQLGAIRLTAASLNAIVLLPVQGADILHWFNRLGADAAFRAQKAIQLGLAQQEPMAAIIRRVLGTTRQPGTAAKLTRAQVSSLVRTSVTQVSAETQFRTYAAQHPTVTDSYEYSATLDDRTTPICQALDGTTWRYDDAGAPRPPQHFGCRSSIVPLVNWEKLGLTPPPTLRASQFGPTSAPNYDAWLKQQSDAFQNRVLGGTQAALYRAGRVTLKELVRTDGRRVTVQQLRDRLGL